MTVQLSLGRIFGKAPQLIREQNRPVAMSLRWTNSIVSCFASLSSGCCRLPLLGQLNDRRYIAGPPMKAVPNMLGSFMKT